MKLTARRFLAMASLALLPLASACYVAAQTPGEAPPAKPAATLSKDAPNTDGKVGFDILGDYPFTPPEYDPVKPDEPVGPRVDEQIPTNVHKLNGREVTITGFMLPTRMENGQVLEFLLLRTQAMCCFGAQPQMNEWIVVRMAKPGSYLPDIPKAFTGTLRVGAVVENGYMSGIYLLENAKAVK